MNALHDMSHYSTVRGMIATIKAIQGNYCHSSSVYKFYSLIVCTSQEHSLAAHS